MGKLTEINYEIDYYFFSFLASINGYKCWNFLRFKYKDTNGNPFDFSTLKGKTVLLTNIATRCGFTGQLDDLEKVYLKYKDKNLVVVGLPSNNFLSQTPEDNKEVGNFCRLKYGVTFPVLEKQDVIGPNKTAIIKWVNSQKEFEGNIMWNFENLLSIKMAKSLSAFVRWLIHLIKILLKQLKKIFNNENPLLAELVITSMLVGLIWVIQLLTYPSFEFVSVENYTHYHRFHVAAITPLVAPMMIFEFLISAYNFLTLSYSRNWGVILVLLLVIIWLATAFLSVPIHNQLVISKDIYLNKKISFN